MKVKRHIKIIELITNEDIETQTDLTKRLKECGFNVTQATVSRDIHDLKLTKTLTSDGKQKYASIQESDSYLNERFMRVFVDGTTSMDCSQNLLVIKTITGAASAVTAALDAMRFSEIIGTIAGNDTVLCITKDEGKTLALMDKLRNIIKIAK